MTPRESGARFGTASPRPARRRRRSRRQGFLQSAAAGERRAQPPATRGIAAVPRLRRRSLAWLMASSHSCPVSPIRPAPRLRQGARTGRRRGRCSRGRGAVLTMRISVCTAFDCPTGSTMMPSTRSWSISTCGGSSAAAVTMMRSKGACSGRPSEPSPWTTVMLCRPSESRSSRVRRARRRWRSTV